MLACHEMLVIAKLEGQEDRFMSEKKLTIGLPIALLLGCSAIAFGVLPGVRDWVDQSMPWLGINGPKDTKMNLVADDIPTIPNGVKTESPVSLSEAESQSAQFMQPPMAMSPEPMNRRHEVEFAGGSIAPAAQSTSPPLAPNSEVRFAQGRTLETVPQTGQNVPGRESGSLIVDLGVLKFFEESSVAAQAEGIITKMLVDEGSMIEAGMPLIELDTRLVEKEIKVSESELNAARLKAKDDSNVKFSTAAREVAQQDVEMSVELLKRDAENYMESVKKRLELKKAGFQVEVSKIEKLRDDADVEVKEAKLEAAKVQLDLRKILSQRTGVVTDVAKRQGDWVRAGEVILRLTSMKKIRVEANAEVKNLQPHLLQNAPARVTISVAEGKSETIDGIVGFVSPRTVAPNKYKLHVDIENRLTPDGQFLFREGMNATIEIMSRTR